MELSFSSLFHTSSKNGSKGHPPIANDIKNWPEEWKTTYYKTYPRFPHIPLLEKNLRADFFDLIRNRVSFRDFSRKKIAFSDLSLLLKYSCGITGKLSDDRFRRAHPSGGARFPIETYIIVLRSEEEVLPGVYHYSVKEHALDVVVQRTFSDKELDMLFLYPWVKDASIIILMTAVFWRTQHKYGERGYRYVLLEAGHIGQNIYLTSQALGLGCTGLGGTRDEHLEKLLDIDGVTEALVYALAIGN